MGKRLNKKIYFYLIVIKSSFLLLFSSCAIGQIKTTICKGEIFNKDTVYRNVDNPPVPKDGYISLFNIINSNIVVDNESIEKLGITKVSILFEFIINSRGNILSCTILEKNEFLHLKDNILSEIYKIEWKPGECNEIKVNTVIIVPVYFRV